ncbi:MAG: hypothetical protein ACI3XJ_07175 [Oscillospiraceae bacterium]
MDPTTLNTIVGIVGSAVGLIGIVVGIIGGKNISDAKKIKNSIHANNGASVQHAQIINNGMDSYAVIRLSKETTQAEMEAVVRDLVLQLQNGEIPVVAQFK